MHIAICDDNVADRKQLERLLKRESDRRSRTTGILYADSFGNAPALLSNPMQYDVFYIDMCRTEGVCGLDVVNGLLAKGVNAPIVMCCSLVNYRELELPSNVIFLDKPIRTEELSRSIDHALSIKSEAPSLIELREDKDTYYVTEPDIVYAVEEGMYVKVTLTDGRKINVVSTAMNLFSQIEMYASFFAPSQKIIVNGRHIGSLGLRKIIMKDGSVFKTSGKCMQYARYALEEFGDK